MAQLNELRTNVTRAVLEAGYATVGIGVIGFQKAQVRRQQLAKSVSGSREQIDTLVDNVLHQISDGVRSVDEVFEGTMDKLDARLDPIEERLPEPARAVVDKARSQAREARNQIKNIVSTKS